MRFKGLSSKHFLSAHERVCNNLKQFVIDTQLCVKRLSSNHFVIDTRICVKQLSSKYFVKDAGTGTCVK